VGQPADVLVENRHQLHGDAARQQRYGRVIRQCWRMKVYWAPTSVGQLDSGQGRSESAAGLHASACVADTEAIHANRRAIESRFRIVL
jgi:hypothetical protein